MFVLDISNIILFFGPIIKKNKKTMLKVIAFIDKITNKNYNRGDEKFFIQIKRL